MAGGSGAMSSDITDLLAWAKSGTGDSLLGAGMVEKRHQYDQVVPTAGALAYGMAQYKFADGYVDFAVPYYKDFYGHSGDALGFGANAVRNDVLNVSIATAANTCGYSDIHDNIVRVVADELNARQSMTPDDDEIVTDDAPPVTDDTIEGTPAPTNEPTSAAVSTVSASMVLGLALLALL